MVPKCNKIHGELMTNDWSVVWPIYFYNKELLIYVYDTYKNMLPPCLNCASAKCIIFKHIYIYLAHIKNVITSKEDQILNCSACLEYNESGFSGKCSKLCLSYIIKERVNKD